MASMVESAKWGADKLIDAYAIESGGEVPGKDWLFKMIMFLQVQNEILVAMCMSRCVGDARSEAIYTLNKGGIDITEQDVDKMWKRKV